MTARFACALALGVLLTAATSSAESRAAADLVLTNAVVHTLAERAPRAQAVAIGGGVILAVGSDAEVRGLVAPGTRVIDLGGATVVPGLIESHAHVMGLGLFRTNLDLNGLPSYRAVVARVAQEAARRQKGEWILGRGWHESKWSEPFDPVVRGFPTHAALSAVSPDNPVVLERADGHALLVNAKAMELAGLRAETPAPAGGEIIHDAGGRPTGVLVDNAADLVLVPPPGPEQRERALGLALEECLRKGITSVTDAGATLEDVALYRRWAEAGRLGPRVYAMLGGLDALKAFGPPQVGLGGGQLTIRAVKLYVDGAMGSRGAAMLEPYADDPGNSGLLRTSPETILEAARLALARGFQVGTHAIGDRGNRLVLDAYARAFAEHPEARDPRFRIEHAQLLDERDIPRFGALGVIASMQGIHATSDRPWAASRVGEARVAEGAYVWQKLLRSGARIANGTDAPVEDVDPIRSFYASVTRQDEKGQPPGGWDPGQRMTREQALRSYTRDAAYAMFREGELGTIEPGKRADLSVLSRDILSVPEPEILKTEVLYTIVDGRIRFERK